MTASLRRRHVLQSDIMAERQVTLEIAIGTLADALAAEAGGADRVELNSALPLGGLTPSLGLLQEVKRRSRLPVMVMIRPRPGACCYSDTDLDVMRRDAELALAHAADGLVFGILTADGHVDAERCRKMLDLIGGKVPAVFHRAFDLTPDPFAAMETLIELGFKRIMSSGQEATAYDGIWKIASLIDEADDRIEIMPAGWINRHNVNDILTRTCCNQIHCGLRIRLRDTSGSGRPNVNFGGPVRGPEDTFDATDQGAVSDLRALLAKLS
jgi:copper homeostasis protein